MYRVPIRAIPKKRGEMTERKSLSKSPPEWYPAGNGGLLEASSFLDDRSLGYHRQDLERPSKPSFRFRLFDCQQLDASVSRTPRRSPSTLMPIALASLGYDRLKYQGIFKGGFDICQNARTACFFGSAN